VVVGTLESIMAAMILENLKFAFSVFISQDVPTARKLIEEKTQLRAAELGSADSHLARLREGRPESIETSSLHLDILRDLKRIHSHICSIAYPCSKLQASCSQIG
jgi:phosphate:Na+ symporter